jgi:hypothetical protein
MWNHTVKANFRSITIVVFALLAGIALNGCSDNNNDDVNRCLPFFGFRHHPLAPLNSTNNVGFGAASIHAAEDGEFTILPVEDPEIIEDAETLPLPVEGGDNNGSGWSGWADWEKPDHPTAEDFLE